MMPVTRTRSGRPAAQRAHRARLNCRRREGATVLLYRACVRSLAPEPDTWSRMASQDGWWCL